MEDLEIYLESSRRGIILFLLLLLITLINVWMTPFFIILSSNLLIKCLLSLLLIFHFFYIVDLHLIKNNNKSVIKIWYKNGRFIFETRNGTKASGPLFGDSFISNYLIILRFKLKKSNKIVLIPADALGVDEYKILCTYLKFYRNFS
jgi:hypothetical protein